MYSPTVEVYRAKPGYSRGHYLIPSDSPQKSGLEWGIHIGTVSNSFSKLKVTGHEVRQSGTVVKVLVDGQYTLDFRQQYFYDLIIKHGLQPGGELVVDLAVITSYAQTYLIPTSHPDYIKQYNLYAAEEAKRQTQLAAATKAGKPVTYEVKNNFTVGTIYTDATGATWTHLGLYNAGGTKACRPKPTNWFLVTTSTGTSYYSWKAKLSNIVSQTSSTVSIKDHRLAITKLKLETLLNDMDETTKTGNGLHNLELLALWPDIYYIDPYYKTLILQETRSSYNSATRQYDCKNVLDAIVDLHKAICINGLLDGV